MTDLKPLVGPVLVVGATGMLGRPVVRRLAADGIAVRALVRNPLSASLLPKGIDLVSGDLRDRPSLEKAISGCSAVYVSVDTVLRARFRAETEGLRNVVAAARAMGAPRLMVLSALGVSRPEAVEAGWWHIDEKREAQEITRSSGLPWTIFEPAWFLESLPLFAKKGRLYRIPSPMASHWISGDDLGRFVSAALRSGSGIGEIISVQGRDSFSLEEAMRRFAAAYGGMAVSVVPRWLFDLISLFSGEARDLRMVLNLSCHPEPRPDPRVWERFAAPEMSVEAYAAYALQAADFPQK